MTTPAPGTAAPAVEAETTTTPVEVPAAPAAPAVPAPAAPAAPAPEVPATEHQGKAPKFEGEFDPAKFERLVENLRGEVATEREKRTAAEKSTAEQVAQQQADLVKKFATALGLTSEEAKPQTVEELTKQLEDSRAETKAAALARQRDRVELAIWQRAAASGGDAAKLQDSRSFMRTIRDFDETASTFAADIETAIKKAIEDNPQLAAKQPEAAPAPARGGADLSGAAGGKRQLTKADVARMTPEQIVKAREAGQLKDYMSGPG